MGQSSRKLSYFIPVILLYLILIGGGLFQVVKESLGFIPAFQMNQVTTAYYMDILGDSSFLRDLAYSLYIAGTGTSLSLVLGIVIAYKLVKSKHPLIKGMVSKVMELGMILPYLYMVFIVVLNFSRTGIVSRLLIRLNLITTLEDFPVLIQEGFGMGIISTYVFKGIPFVTLFLMNVMGNISNDYDQVAKNLGSSEDQLLRELYLPLSKDLIVWTSMVLFAFQYGAFEVPYLLSSQKNQTLSIRLFSAYISPSIETLPKAMAMAVILFVTGIVFVSLYAKLMERILVIQPRYGKVNKVAGYFKKIKASIGFSLIILVILGSLLTFLYIVLLSFNSQFRYPMLFPHISTMTYWQNLLRGNSLFYRSLYSSFLVAGMAAVLSTTLGFITAKGISSGFPLKKHKVLMLISLPLFIPGMSLFLGAHQVLIHTVFANHWFGIVLVHLLVCLPYSTNIGVAYFDGLPDQLEQVAKTLGAGRIKVIQSILLPILTPGILLSLAISFLISNTQYFSTFLLGGGNVITFSMIMYPYISNSDMNNTAVMGILFLFIHVMIFFMLNRLLKGKNTFKALYNMET